MELIIGGAFQGKLDYAKKKYGFSEENIFDCAKSDGIDFSADCIYHFERYVLKCVENNIDGISTISSQLPILKNTVIICDDISCGVVPMEPRLRAWRELTGRILELISNNSQIVTRVFCGIPQRIK